MASEQTIALLVAAGKSERLQAGLPKPYLQLGNEAMVHRAAKVFLAHPGIDGVRVVIRREHHALYKQAMQDFTLFPCVVGGESRQDSVRLGLESIAHRKPKRVLIHDVARPLASEALISRVIGALSDHKAAIPALAVVDTLKRAANNRIIDTVSRDGLFAVQTPQGFDFDALMAAHQRFRGEQLTDDAALCEKAGIDVALVEGEPGNIKVTTQTDFEHMQTLLSLTQETRTGMGYDVHALKPHAPDTASTQRDIKICGVRIPHSHYLEGHSDADVGLHALVDAMLGAIGAGDIGMHFSPEDAKWKGADSERFLLYAYQLVKERGGDIVHLDVTLVCEKPKIAPHRQQMISHIAQLLKIAPDRISVKATTTEKLGFTGRGEGIAAQAVATIRLPRT